MKKITLLLSALICISCYTDNNDINIIAKDTQLLRRILLNGEALYNFEYYPDNKIKAQITLSGGAISGLTSYEYLNDTIYKTTSGYIFTKYKSFKSDSNTLTLIQYNINDDLLFYYISKYSSSNCNLEKTETLTQFGQLYTKTEYNYIDSYCSYNSKKEFFNGEQKNKYAIIKDDKNNYSTSLNEWPSFEKKHNIIEYRKWDADDNLVLNSCYNSTFVYDNNNYPIQETRTSLSGITKVFTYEYY